MKKKLKSIGEKIDVICEKRDLEYLVSKTSEIFHWNSFYGIDKIVKKYAGITSTYAIKGVWPHGIWYNKDRVLDKEKKVRLPVVFCYPPYRAETYRDQTDKTVILSAHPFLYLLDLVDFEPETREGTVFFPQHSTQGATAEMDFDALARKLVELDEEYQPVTICLYWKDYLMGRAEPFIDHGLPVVSAGHFYDQSFLKRFYEICACHEYAAGNSIGSHIFLSVASGCSYFHVDGIDYELTGEEKYVKDFKKDDDIVRRINDTFGNYPPTDRARQVAEARYFLGAEYKRSRSGLIGDLFRAEVADKLQIKGDRGRVARYLPRFWQRSLSRLTGKARRVLNQMRI